MLFKDWIPTQPETIWGTLDAAAQEHIKEEFAYREICDDQKMALFFSRDIAEYTDHYYAMFRLQQANKTFQPHINKYGEFLKISQGSGSRTSDTTSSNSKTGSETDTRSRTEKWTKSGKTIDSGSKQSVTTGGKTVTDAATKSGTSTEKRTGSEKTGRHTDTIESGGSENVNYNRERETLSFTGRASEKTINGTVSRRTVGDSDKNFTKDGPNSSETSSHKRNTTDTTRQLGTKIIEEDQARASQSRQANKAAPQNAVGITRVSDDGTSAFHGARDGAITGLDFEFASAYGETAGQEGTTATRREYYDGDNNIIQSVGTAADNTDTTNYNRDQRTGTDLTETTGYSGYSEKESQTGSEAREKTGGHSVIKESEETRNYGEVSKESSGTTSGTDTQTISGQEKTTENSSVNDTTDNTRTDSGTEDGSYADNGTKSSKGTSEGSIKATAQTQDQKSTTNRYTGREGLTPQEALKSALEYLRTNPPCIVWLCSMLEHNFIRVYDI